MWAALLIAGVAMFLAKVSAGDAGGGGGHDIAVGHQIIKMLLA
jgi:hypothetical protein